MNKKATPVPLAQVREQNNKRTAQMSQAQVVEYLESHPQFFVDKHALLSKMTLVPMQQGNVYDFTACQIAYLQKKNQQLSDKGAHLLDLVQHNQNIIAHTQEVVDGCLLATDRDALFAHFRVAWQEPFELPANALVISTRKQQSHALQRLLDETRFESIYCGAISNEESNAIFGQDTVASIVLSGFQYQKSQQVLLAIGSKEEGHFHGQLDTSAFRLVQSIFQYQFTRLPAK